MEIWIKTPRMPNRYGWRQITRSGAGALDRTALQYRTGCPGWALANSGNGQQIICQCDMVERVQEPSRTGVEE